MHGYDLFASNAFGADVMGMSLERSFHMHDCTEGTLEDVAKDGVPTNAIGLTEPLRAACAPHEFVREGVALFQNLTPVVRDSISIRPTARLEVIPRGCNMWSQSFFALKISIADSDEIYELLKDPSNGVILRVSSAVEKGPTSWQIIRWRQSICENRSPETDAREKTRVLR